MKKHYPASTYLFLIILSLTALTFSACSSDNAGQEKNAQTSSKVMTNSTQTPPSPPAGADSASEPEKQQASQAADLALPEQEKNTQKESAQPQQTSGNGTSDKGEMNMGGNATIGAEKAENTLLLHRRFLLLTMNGTSFAEKEKRPSLEFNEGFRISGGICNRFTGMAELANGKLTAKQLASTKMFCTDQELNELETNFALLLANGASLDFDGQKLILRGTAGDKDIELVYELRDLVQ